MVKFEDMEGHNAMEVGHKIRRIREIKGIKQETIANQIGIAVSSYGKIERGEIQLSVDRLQAIAEALELPVNSILEYDEGVNNFINSNTFNTTGLGGFFNTSNSHFHMNNEETLLKQIEVLMGMLKSMEHIVATQKDLINELRGINN
jgi:transcriptional regulator with XRE-family HTH domain